MSVTSSNTSKEVSDGRGIERLAAELKTIVQVRESDTETWKEVTKVSTVSRNGAGFELPRPCIVGRLVSLVMPLDPELRAYDKTADVYPVMGLVQYCNEGLADGKKVYHVGVGFIGKKVPESFKADPKQSYRINGMGKDGLWEITEADSQFKKRKQPRYWISLPATVTLIQRSDTRDTKQDTYTKNIGSGGVSVVCSLVVGVGEKVKFACKDVNFYAIALVRNRKVLKDGMVTLHLEFQDAEFPIDKVVATTAGIVADPN